jgi:hypothetical protein
VFGFEAMDLFVVTDEGLSGLVSSLLERGRGDEGRFGEGVERREGGGEETWRAAISPLVEGGRGKRGFGWRMVEKRGKGQKGRGVEERGRGEHTWTSTHICKLVLDSEFTQACAMRK